MVHSLFLESCATVELASRLLFVVLTVCVSHEAHTNGKISRAEDYSVDHIAKDSESSQSSLSRSKTQRDRENPIIKKSKKQGHVVAFDSYVLAAVCALACELQLFPLIANIYNPSSSKDSVETAKPVKLNSISHEFKDGIDSAIHHTRRILTILEAFSLKPSTIGISRGYSSNEIVAAAMVAAHISDLFRRSKACMNALSVLMHCKWDNEIHTRASSLYNLIDIHRKAIASIAHKAEPLEAHLYQTTVWRDPPVINARKKNCAGTVCIQSEVQSTIKCEDSSHLKNLHNCGEALYTDNASGSTMGKRVVDFQFDASDVAHFLTMDRHIGLNCSVQIFLQSVLEEKPELCFSVVSLLWHKLIASPETQPSAESTSAQQGWRQVIDALCNVVSASPRKAATGIVLQAARELQPWIAKYDDQGQKMWKINQRIVKLIVELMRNYDTPESLAILANASDLLLRATDGMLVDGEACTLPQLELLEATARELQPVLKWGESGYQLQIAFPIF